MKNKKTNKIERLTLIVLVLIIIPYFVYADSWTSSQPSHATLYADTLTSKTDGSSVNIADTQGLFVTGDITTLGKVGIGTTGPSQQLQIKAISNYPQLYLTQYNDDRGWKFAGLADGHLHIYSSYHGADTERMTITYDTGNVGIGTITPDTLLRLGTGYIGVNNLYGIRSRNAANTAWADLINLQADDSLRLYDSRVAITSGGNVGIGTTRPGAKLEIVDGDSQLSTSSGLQSRNVPGNPFSLLYVNANDQVTINAPDNDIAIRFTQGSAGERMRIGAGGNVGIGTTGPTTKLDVRGGVNTAYSGSTIANMASGLFVGGDQAVTARFGFGVQNGLFYQGSNDANNQNFDFRAGTADGSLGTVNVRIQNNGNVGIGTTSPQALLHVVTSTTPNTGMFRLTNNAGGVNQDFFIHSGARAAGSWPFTIDNTVATIQASGTNAMNIAFASGNSEKMRIDTSGNVGIGTTTPARKLHISDAMRLQPIASPPSSPSSGDLYFDNSEALCVYVSGAWSKIAGAGTCA